MSITDQSRSTFNLGLGAMSPLWPAFALAAGTGAAMFWMSRWSYGRWQPEPTHLEALLAAPEAVAETVIEVALAPEPDAVVEAAPEVVAEVEAATEPTAAAPVEAEPAKLPIAPRPKRAKPADASTL